MPPRAPAPSKSVSTTARHAGEQAQQRPAELDWPETPVASPDSIDAEKLQVITKWREEFPKVSITSRLRAFSWLGIPSRGAGVDKVRGTRSIDERKSPVLTGDGVSPLLLQAAILGLPLDHSGPWVYLMGKRTPTEHRGLLSALTQVLILFADRRGELRAGHFLQECYRLGLMPRPATAEVAKTQAEQIHDILAALDIWSDPRADHERHIDSEAIESASSIQEVMDLPPSGPFQIRKPLSQDHSDWRTEDDSRSSHSDLESTNSEIGDSDRDFFSTHSLDIESLMGLGQLKIIWTSSLMEHLLLNRGGRTSDDASTEEGASANSWRTGGTADAGATLKVFWFDASETPSKIGSALLGIPEKELHLAALEVVRTWSFLFHGVNERKIRSRYGKLSLPKWTREYLGHEYFPDLLRSPNANPSALENGLLAPQLDLKYVLGKGADHVCHDVQQHLHKHLHKYNVSKKGGYRYDLFPLFSERIRDLREYMDRNEPRTLKGLWKDRRNTLGFYTFWIAALFGTASIFLAAFSLAVSVAQTWAAFNPQSVGS